MKRCLFGLMFFAAGCGAPLHSWDPISGGIRSSAKSRAAVKRCLVDRMSGVNRVPQVTEALGSTRVLVKSTSGNVLWDFLITDAGAGSRIEIRRVFASTSGGGIAESCL